MAKVVAHQTAHLTFLGSGVVEDSFPHVARLNPPWIDDAVVAAAATILVRSPPRNEGHK
jgi:hypothetical protein